MRFHQQILNQQVRELIRQLVENGAMNIPFPVSGRTDLWAQFYWGDPAACSEDWQSPRLFAYDFEVSESFSSMNQVRTVANFLIGLQGKCANLAGHETTFENLWWKIQRLGSSTNYAALLPGSYRITGPDGQYATYSQTNLHGLGIADFRILGSLPLYTNGKIQRFLASAEMTFYFPTAPVTITSGQVITHNI